MLCKIHPKIRDPTHVARAKTLLLSNDKYLSYYCIYKQFHCVILVRVTLCVVYSCRCLGMTIMADIYGSLQFHLEPCCVIALNCLLFVPTHHEMYNEIQKRFTAASSGAYVKPYGYRNANQLIIFHHGNSNKTNITVRDKELTSLL